MTGENSKAVISEVFHNRYLIRSIIGKGGMGTVYLAEDLKLKGKLWAIKEIVVQETNYQQFVDEAKILIALDHTYLPKIIDYYPPDENGNSYLVMDYINGQTLLKLFEEKNKILPYKQIIKYVLQICNLFDYLHNQQQTPVIYRDLKPANIMIDEQDNVRLIDFGIARNYKEGKLLDTIQMGTVGFAAPEQFEDKQTDHRADIYSLGALMYFLFSQGLFYHTLQQPLNLIRKDLPLELTQIVMRMLMANPGDRYQNIVEIKRELEYLTRDVNREIPATITIAKKDSDYKKKDSGKDNSYPIYQKIYTNISPKIVAVINLSRRAGSTFVTVNLAKFLSELMILTRIIELPFEPYIFDHIGLEQRLNKTHNEESLKFYSYPHFIYDDKKTEREKETIDEGIIWTVTDPRRPLIDKAKWTYNHMVKLLNSSRKASITILDIGENRKHKSIEPLLDEVDLILTVIEPMPSEIMINNNLLDQLLKAKQKGSPVEFIINYWTDGINREEIKKVLPIEPLSIIPAIELTYIHKAVYDCVIPYSVKEIKEKLDSSLLKIAKKIVPDELINIEQKENQEKVSWLNRWIKRG